MTRKKETFPWCNFWSSKAVLIHYSFQKISKYFNYLITSPFFSFSLLNGFYLYWLLVIYFLKNFHRHQIKEVKWEREDEQQHHQKNDYWLINIVLSHWLIIVSLELLNIYPPISIPSDYAKRMSAAAASRRKQAKPQKVAEGASKGWLNTF